MNYIIDKIEKLEIKDIKNDVIVMTFDPDEIDFCSAADCFQGIKNSLPEHNLLGVVKGIELEVDNIDYLINQLQKMKEEKTNEDIH